MSDIVTVYTTVSDGTRVNTYISGDTQVRTDSSNPVTINTQESEGVIINAQVSEVNRVKIFEEGPPGPPGIGVSGAVFITDITSDGNTLVTRNAEPNEESLSGVTTDTYNMRVNIEWDRTGTEYEGLPTVNGESVVRTGRSGGTNYGYADISAATNSIEARYAGQSHIIPVTTVSGPVITSASFDNIYPSGRGATPEFKQGENATINIIVDIPVDRVEFENSGPFSNVIRTVSGTNINTTAPIRYTGNTPQLLSGRVRARSSENGSWGDYITITNQVRCCDLTPSVETLDQSDITYPVGQSALKGNETASVHCTVSDFDSISYESPSGQISIGSSTVYSLNKVVQRVNGGYNVSVNNLRVTAQREANATITSREVCIYIADTPVALSSNIPVQVRSGLGGVTIPCSFNQTVTGWSNPSVTAIASDLHGTYIENPLSIAIAPVNRAGIVSNLTRAYFIQGFAQRMLTLTYPEEEAAIGINGGVTDTDSLIVSGTINSTPSYPVCDTYVADRIGVNSVGEFTVAPNNTHIFINRSQCAIFGYGANNITVNIEET